jgi:AMMECR1 domain-containing protein
MSNPHPLVKLARETIERYVRGREIPQVPPEEELAPEMKEQGGVFAPSSPGKPTWRKR